MREFVATFGSLGPLGRWLLAPVAIGLLVAATVGAIGFLGARRGAPSTPIAGTRPPGSADNSSPSLPLTELGSRLDAILAGVVRLETVDERVGRTAVGAGFILDTKGTIATSYHVIRDAAHIEVLFSDGRRLVPRGVLAADPQLDLAILQLDPSARSWVPLTLARDPRAASFQPVAAVGHPRGYGFTPLEGRVSRLVHTSELPGDSRRFVDFVLGSRADHAWIQHTVPISDGCSGGPLLNAQGEVIGINTWIQGETGLSYALSIDHLRALETKRLDKAVSLGQYRRDYLSPFALARGTKEGDVALALRIWQELRQAPAAPLDAMGYRRLQSVASAVSLAERGVASGTEISHMELLRRAIRADLTSGTLHEVLIAPALREHALRHLHEPGSGLLVETAGGRIVRGKLGERALLVTIAGLDQDLLIPLDVTSLPRNPAGRRLIFGVLSGEVIPFGSNPLDRRLAHVLSRAWWADLED